MRGVSPRRVFDAAPPVAAGLRVCGYRSCSALILSCAGTSATNRCNEHQGVTNEPETDDERIERVCRAMGWRRSKQ